MMIETKKLADNEILLFFAAPLPLQGAFYYSPQAQSAMPLLQNIATAGLAEEMLLTADFMYLKSTKPSAMADLEALALAEIDDAAENFSVSLKVAASDNTAAKSKIIIKAIIAPFLQRDGGDLELLSYKKGLATVRFLGKCQGCPYAQRTLKERVEKNLIRYLPEIREVALA